MNHVFKTTNPKQTKDSIKVLFNDINNKKPIDQKLNFYKIFFKNKLINNSSIIQSHIHSFINHYSLNHNNIYLTDNSTITRNLFEIS